MAGESKRVLCAAYKCDSPQEWKVFYRTALGPKITTDNWARVCRRHAVDFPISWGTILRKEPIKK